MGDSAALVKPRPYTSALSIPGGTQRQQLFPAQGVRRYLAKPLSLLLLLLFLPCLYSSLNIGLPRELSWVKTRSVLSRGSKWPFLKRCFQHLLSASSHFHLLCLLYLFPVPPCQNGNFRKTGVSIHPQSQGPHYIPVLGTDHFQ